MIGKHAIGYCRESGGSKLDERRPRLWADGEVRTTGGCELAMVSKLTGLACSTINRGAGDLDEEGIPNGQVRRNGGCRKFLAANDPDLVPELKRLVEPAPLRDAKWALIWVSKSMDRLATMVEQEEPACLKNGGHLSLTFAKP